VIFDIMSNLAKDLPQEPPGKLHSNIFKSESGIGFDDTLLCGISNAPVWRIISKHGGDSTVLLLDRPPQLYPDEHGINHA
jgi:hypothetical protein